ncbi:hypothetical protein ACQKKK_20575 [Peribacillus sp. NPDC006672]|uniref:hypothetical protein n=1 Tax=Peribacillus sp. NPDC006672 TaxID=3390606 RepID=UPI003D0284E1
MAKRYLILLGFFLFAITPLQTVKAESVSKVEQEIYVTTEDIISDIVFLTIDKKVQKEYSDNMIGWKWKRIAGIKYNDNHSFDVTVRIQVPSQHNDYVDDLVKERISPSCNSENLNKLEIKPDTYY